MSILDRKLRGLMTEKNKDNNRLFAKGLAKLSLYQSSILCWTYKNISKEQSFVINSQRKENEQKQEN